MVRQRKMHGMALKLALSFTMAVLILSNAGCILPSDPGPTLEIGVATAGGNLLGFYNPCASQPNATQLTLYRSGGHIGASDDLSLWRVRSEQPITISAFVVGQTPPGFTTTQQMQEVPADLDLDLVLEVTRVDGKTTRVAFRRNQLKPDQYLLAGGKFMPIDEYPKANTCQLAR